LNSVKYFDLNLQTFTADVLFSSSLGVVSGSTTSGVSSTTSGVVSGSTASGVGSGSTTSSGVGSGSTASGVGSTIEMVNGTVYSRTGPLEYFSNETM